MVYPLFQVIVEACWSTFDTEVPFLPVGGMTTNDAYVQMLHGVFLYQSHFISNNGLK